MFSLLLRRAGFSLVSLLVVSACLFFLTRAIPAPEAAEDAMLNPRAVARRGPSVSGACPPGATDPGDRALRVSSWSGGAWPRTPETRTRSAPACSSSIEVRSTVTSGPVIC